MGRCLPLIAALALATGAQAADILVAKKGATAKTVKQIAKSVGVVTMRHSSGFFWVRVKKGVSAERAIAAMRGKGMLAFPESARKVDFNSLDSVETYIEFHRKSAELRGIDDPEEAGVDFFEGLEYYLKDRVDQTGRLDPVLYKNAVRQREQMPAARSEWFSQGQVGAQSTTGLFSSMGPANLDIPYRTYYGVRSLSGRKNDVAIAASNPSIMYVASAGGGVWKTTDSGTNWLCLTDDWQFLHTSAVTVHPTDPNTLLVATGDYNGFFTAQAFGIMRSTDGGATWVNVGNGQFGSSVVSEIMIHPQNPNIVIATTANGTADIWRSTDGGVTWGRTNATDDRWSDLDISGVAGPSGNRRIWAAGSGTTKIAYSDDLGATWTNASVPSQFSATEGEIDIAASQTQWDDAYSIAPNNDKIVRTTNGGSTWTDITGPGIASWSQDTYNLHITCGRADSQTDILYVGLISLHASRDLGATWVDIAGTATGNAKWHNDQHNMTMHPSTPNVGFAVGDGGICKVELDTVNMVGTFTMLNATINDTQAYAMSIHPTDYASRIIIGTQDNASPASRGNIAAWANLYAGDGGFSGFDGTNPAKHYSTSQSGGVYRYDSNNDTSPTDIGVSGAPFVTNLLMAGPGRSTVYVPASSKVKRNANGTSGWTDSVTTLNSTPQNIVRGRANNRIFTCHGLGVFWLSTDNGANFTRLGDNLPDFRIGDLAESLTADNDVIVGLKTTDPNTGRVYRSTTANVATTTWTDISGSGATALPKMPVNAIAMDPHDANVIFVGTDVGAFMTVDSGANWYNMGPLGLPNVHVNDLEVTPDGAYLYVATFGRGVWRIPMGNNALASLTAPAKVYGGAPIVLSINMASVASPGTRVDLVDNSSLVATPPYRILPGGSATLSTNLATQAVTSPTNVTITGSYRAVNRAVTVQLIPTPNFTMSLNPNPVTGSLNSTLTVNLPGPAEALTQVELSETSGFANVARRITIPVGATSGTAVVTTTLPSTQQIATINGYIYPNSANVKSANLTILPAPVSTAFTISPATVSGGGTVTCTVTIDRPAPSTGWTYNIKKVSTVTGPIQVTIPAGQTQASFNLTAPIVTVNSKFAVRVIRGTDERQAQFTATP